jgi:Leucine-rich repeat (LRR) protein
MKKHFLALVLCVLTTLGVFSASAAEDSLGEPIITFKTNIYDTYGSSNSFSFVIGCSSTEIEYFQVDAGFGAYEVEVEPAIYDEDAEEVTGTNITCNVSEDGIVKIYGDPSIVEYFNADGCYIEDIDLSKLTNLDILSLSHNELKKLDLSDFSALRAVYVTDNTFSEEPFKLGSNHPGLVILEMNYIGHLDQSFNLADYPALMSLDAWNVTELNYLDPTKCPYLYKLSIDGTPVKSLDTSKNAYLQILNISDSGVTSLDLSKNTNLTQLYCSHESGSLNTDTKLNSLDLSNNTKLVYLFCSGNNLTTLDVSKNTALTQLHARANQLSSLDLTNNPNLYSVKISNNNMDFATLPDDQDTWSEYEYQQRPMTMEKSYEAGTKLDFSKRVLREGTETSGILVAYDEANPETYTILDDSYYTYENGIMTVHKEYKDSVYCIFHNSALSDYDLTTAKFKIKSAAEYGQPTKVLSFTSGIGIGSKVELSIGMDGASATNPRTVMIDFGDGNLKSFEITTSEAPATANVTATKPSYGTIAIYAPEGETLTGFGAKDFTMYSIDLSAAPCLRNLFLINTGLYTIDMQWNRCLTSLDLSGNNFSTLTLEGANGYYGKNALLSVNVSNNKLTEFTLNENMTLVDLNISHNQLTEFTFKTILYLQNLDFSYNKLTELDLSDCDVLANVNVSNNQLTSITLPETIESLDIRNNQMTYATLPARSEVRDYLYAPQSDIVIPTKGPGIDLSDYNPDGKTVYTWKRVDGGNITEGTDFTCDGGKTHFINTNMGDVYCEMTNSDFTDFTGENVLKTSNIEAAEMPTNVIASFTTLVDDEEATLTLTAAKQGTAVYVDWNGNSDDLAQYVLATSYTNFTANTKAGVNVKVYSYDDVDNVTVFSLRNVSLSDVDGSKMKQLINFTVNEAGTEGKLTDIKFPKSEGLGELVIQNSQLTNIDYAQYPALYTLILANNKLTSADLTTNPKITYASFANNELTSFKADSKLIWGLDLGTNKLESVDLSNLPNLQQLSLYGNELSTVDVDMLSNLRVLYVDHNKFTFTTLPAIKDQYALYTYANQAEYQAEIVDNKVDLSEQASVNGVETTYRWFLNAPELEYNEDTYEYELIGEELIVDEEFDVEGGVTTFHPLSQLYPVVGVMQNTEFPDLYLYTNAFTVEAGSAGVNNITVDNSNAKVSVVDHKIYVTAPAGVTVNVYGVNGVQVASTTTDNDGNAVVGPVQNGVYVVTVANLGTKVLVK